MFNLHGNKGNMLCPTLYSLRAQGAWAGAMLDYWQSALKVKMPRLEFKGRSWDTESGTADLTKSNVVVVVSETLPPHKREWKVEEASLWV